MSVIINNGEKDEASYQGCVISTRERNMYDDSDFIAVVWDETEGKVKEVEYATTRFWTYKNSAVVDVTPENKAKAEKWAYENTKRRLFQSYVSSLKEPQKGDKVIVKSGRKVPLGTEGVLFYIGASYGYGIGKQTRIGIATSERKIDGKYADVAWIYLHNVEAVPSCKFKLSEIKRKIRGLKNHPINSYFYCYS